MKTAISIPDNVFRQADHLAKRLHMSRSEIYTHAVKEYIGEHRHARVTERLNEVYSTESSAIDPALLNAQAASLLEEEW